MLALIFEFGIVFFFVDHRYCLFNNASIKYLLYPPQEEFIAMFKHY